MMDSLKDLERDIEIFHDNVVASNELNYLLRGLIGQTRASREAFDKSSEELLSSLGTIPESVKDQNREHGEEIRADLDTALSGAVDSFNESLTGYLQSIQSAQDDIAAYAEQTKSLPDELGEKNSQSAEQLQQLFEEKLSQTLAAFTQEQDRYVEILKQAEGELTAAKESVKEDAEQFHTRSSELPTLIDERNASCLEQVQETVGSGMSNALATFSEEQEKYLQAIKESEAKLEESQRDLTAKYENVIGKLEEISNSGLLSLKSEFEERTRNQNILIVVMGILAIVATLSRFFI